MTLCPLILALRASMFLLPPQIMDRLLSGRLCFASTSLGLCKLAMAVAVRFSEARPSFGPSPNARFVVMSCGSQMRSLIPRLAQVYAMQVGLGASSLLCILCRVQLAPPLLCALLVFCTVFTCPVAEMLSCADFLLL